eukprot:Nitzschia sp. Nitz4//scaffold115_size69933//47363//53133//NITZ4_006008-RA/size69933-snap-gene-0.86-mRNA-1//-1//CDS//3329533517//3663//frame0
MSASKPRPIHTLPRDLRETPDEAEPSYSYEDHAFLSSSLDNVEDEFHRRLAGSTRGSNSGGGHGSSSTSALPPLTGLKSTIVSSASTGAVPGGGIGATLAATGPRKDKNLPDSNGPPSNGSPNGNSKAAAADHKASSGSTTSSFWRTNLPAKLPQFPSQPVVLRERKSSGGLLGAALQLHSQSQEHPSHPMRSHSGGLEHSYKRSGSSMSQNSSGPSALSRESKKNISKQRTEARRLKFDSHQHEVDIGHVWEDRSMPLSEAMDGQANNAATSTRDGNESILSNDSHSDGGASPQHRALTPLGHAPSSSTSGGHMNSSSSSLGHFFKVGSGGRTTTVSSNTTSNSSGSAVMFGKSSSLIFPTGVEPPASADSDTVKKHKIHMLLDQCESVRLFKKKLMLNNLHLTAADIPVRHLHGTSLGNTLHKLSLAGNRLSSIPPKLVVCMPLLKTLDLSQCELHQLPETWKLPRLRRLNLSHNRLTDFLEETMLEGLGELEDLNMYGNKISVLVLPHNPKLLSNLETLNLGYNDLAYIPDELDRLKSLRTLKVMNNLLEKIPMRVCDMDLKTIDVSSNPLIQPPIETCERGISAMKRYYHCLRTEALAEKKKSKPKSLFGLKVLGSRKATEDTPSVPAPNDMTPERRAVSLSSAPATKSRSAAFSLDTPEDVRRSASLDSKPTTPIVHTASSEPSLATIPASPPKTVKVSEPSDPTTPAARSRMDSTDLIGLSNEIDDVTVNDTLKVIFVGMAEAGKTSMIKRLIEGEGAIIPKRDERTIGVDIYEWDPKDDHRFEHIDSRILLQDKELEEQCGDVNVKLSVWDFAGQGVYHATHELFFSPRALYVLVWDMGAQNERTKPKKIEHESKGGAFSLDYDSDSDEDDTDQFTMEEELVRADRELRKDIDDKIQFWVDCIQTSAPGAAILPVASFDDLFAENPAEAKRRCNILKKRLLDHEARRIEGIQQRLQGYVDDNRANDEGALRLRKLLGSYSRPKLIFGNTEDDAVVRVSGLRYTGFAELTERIIHIATGRERANMQYPIFRGHVGARIPRMRLEVREAVRRMRDRFKVVEWGYFISQLHDQGLHSVEDIGDALHFLTNIGELSYFGGEMTGRSSRDVSYMDPNGQAAALMGITEDTSVMSDEDDDDDDDDTTEDNGILSMDTTSETLPTTETGSIATLDETLSRGLSQFVFLNPRWLVAAVACILRHDLDREIQETRRALSHVGRTVSRGESFYDSANMNCPVITADDACMLWQAKKFTKKAAERVEAYSNKMPVKPFEFLQLLLVRFGVFVPIDLGIEKAFLGGIEYSHRLSGETTTPEEITIGQSNTILKATFFFLPSLLGPGEPAEAWTYKSTDSWKATLCHSVLFPDGVPPGLMERITASVLSSIYAIAHNQEKQTYRGFDGTNVPTYEGQLSVKEVLCWRTAFLVKLGTQSGEDNKESIVEVFCGLVDKESHLCVGSDHMVSGTRRLVTSGKGQEGNGGRKIWQGGYLIVLRAVQKVMDEYGGLEYEKQGFCPDCLAKKSVAEASYWDFTVIRNAVKNSETTLRCRYGHPVDTRLVAGPLDSLQTTRNAAFGGSEGPVAPLNQLLRAIVVVGLWDGKTRKVIRVGSGFIADKKRGLIVTASHTLMNIWGDKSTPFGENYYGLRQGKVVIGVIPRKRGEETGTEAVFRYFAKIVSKDPSIDQGVCHLDACVLKITTRMENDVGGSGEGCADQPERLLLNNALALKQEKLHYLKLSDKYELDEQVRIIGYNQGGEGLLGPGVSLNRSVDFARGYVCKKFATSEDMGTSSSSGANQHQSLRNKFKPREEIVVMCPTIGGHSGGPCVNQQGEVIGILSRADPAESQRCYLAPTYEWRHLLKEARNAF